ncbi:MAG: mRNA surveillance protein pelota [Candidatus Aenigmarchaeota archaeon]|nr:mRNA surveillance protein pelota [Candidatus Aenigmarchaeota archaeon]
MKITEKDLKHGVITVIPENQDDLWVLEKIINPGTSVSGYTVRSIKILQGDREVRSEKRRIFVKLRAEKIDFSGDQLRVGGIIIESSEGDRSHHAFEIEVNRPVSIEKEWKGYEIEKLEKAKTRHPPILIAAIDDAEAGFAFLTERLEMLTTIYGSTGKSMGEHDSSAYYADIISYIKSKQFHACVLAGPGFAKENVMNILKTKEPEVAKKVHTDSVSYAGEAGIQEVLRRGIVEKIIRDSSVSEQTKLVEDFFAEVSKGTKAAYGPAKTKAAIEAGAAEMLLVSDEKAQDYEDLMKLAERYGGRVKIIDSHHDAGKRFLSFGGVGAFLRYGI